MAKKIDTTELEAKRKTYEDYIRAAHHGLDTLAQRRARIEEEQLLLDQRRAVIEAEPAKLAAIIERAQGNLALLNRERELLAKLAESADAEKITRQLAKVRKLRAQLEELEAELAKDTTAGS